MDCTARATNWRNWSSWCRRFNFNTFLVGTPREQHAQVLMTFAARVRAGASGNGKQIGCQSVATALLATALALRHVSQTFVLANRCGPRRDLYSPKLDLAFTRPAVPQLQEQGSCSEASTGPTNFGHGRHYAEPRQLLGPQRPSPSFGLGGTGVLLFAMSWRVSPLGIAELAPRKSNEKICSVGISVPRVSWIGSLHF